MKKLLFLTLPIIVLAGCATTGSNTNAYIPQKQNISEPPLNTVTTVSIGDKMLFQGTATQGDALYFLVTQKYYYGGTIQQGYYAKTKEDDKYTYFNSTNNVGSGKFTDIMGASIPVGLSLRKSDNAICVPSILGNGGFVCSTDLKFEKRNWATASNDDFQQTLLYNGRVGNKINIAYREFSSNLARPAFNNDVEYDLSVSKEIAYKGALIEVIKADNKEITYKILSNFK